MAPPFMNGWLQQIIEAHDFKKFDADARWNKSKSKMLVVGVDVSDVDAVSKITGTKKKTMANRKVVDLELNTWKLRFRESHKKGGSKAPDAKTTAMQEKGSKFVFEYVLENKKSGYANFDKFKSDKKLVDGIKKIYPDVDDDWLDVFFKQHKVILDKFASSKINHFDHSGDGSFMNVITEIVNKNFGITKKDNWNPADVWLIKNEKKHRDDIEEAMKGPTTSKRMGVVEANLNQFNEIFRQLFLQKQIMGISLKKVSGDVADWKEVNVTEKFFKHIESIEMTYTGAKCKFGPGVVTVKQAERSQRKNELPTKAGYFTLETQETMITLKDKESNTEFEIQIKANDSSKFDNLKYEPKDLKNKTARLGKATSAYVDDLVEYYGIRGWKKSYKDYPQSLATPFKYPFTKREQDKYLGMITELQSEGVDIGNVTPLEAVINIRETFSRTSLPFVANSKLMQVNWLYNFLTLSTKNRNKMVTDMIFLAEKAGRRYGPYGKLY